MKLRYLIYASVISLAFAGCAANQETERAITQLTRQYSEMRTSLDEANSRIQDLGNKFALLQEKMEDSRAEMDRLAASAVPVAAPEGLKVVPVGAEEARIEVKPEPKPEPRHETRPVQQKAKKATAPLAKEKEEGADEKTVTAEDIYGLGQDLFISGRYDESRRVFSSLLKAFPRHSLADNALYWIGESYYAEKDFEKALEKFRETADKYPEENKAPEALLKAGFALMEMDRKDEAAEALNRVISRYPASEAALKAKKTLEKTGVKEGKR